jgi:hypothetical protein
MKKKQIPDTPINSVFEIGDLVSTQNGIMKVILEVTKDDYKFMRLKEEYINTTSGRYHLKKGEIATQPKYVFDKYHYLYQP